MIVQLATLGILLWVLSGLEKYLIRVFFYLKDRRNNPTLDDIYETSKNSFKKIRKSTILKSSGKELINRIDSGRGFDLVGYINKESCFIIIDNVLKYRVGYSEDNVAVIVDAKNSDICILKDDMFDKYGNKIVRYLKEHQITKEEAIEQALNSVINGE